MGSWLSVLRMEAMGRFRSTFPLPLMIHTIQVCDIMTFKSSLNHPSPSPYL